MIGATTDPVVVRLETKSVRIPKEYVLPTAKLRHDRGTYYDVQPLIDEYHYPLISAGAYLHHRRRLAELICEPIGLSAEAAFHIEYQSPGVWARRAIAADILLDSDVDLAYEWAIDNCDPLGRWIPAVRPDDIQAYLTRRRPYLDRLRLGIRPIRRQRTLPPNDRGGPVTLDGPTCSEASDRLGAISRLAATIDCVGMRPVVLSDAGRRHPVVFFFFDRARHGGPSLSALQMKFESHRRILNGQLSKAAPKKQSRNIVALNSDQESKRQNERGRPP